MIDASMSDEINKFNARSADALGYNIPGYQPSFHDVLDQHARSIKSFDPLSVLAPENAYFVVDNGDGSHSYTRSGDFRISQGQLVTRDGRAVLGYPNGVEKGTLAPITVPQGVPDGSVRISSDGTVSYGGGDASAVKAAGALAPGIAHAPPVTDVRASENLPAPASAAGKNYDVPDIALDSDANLPMVSLPAEAGHITPHAVLSQEMPLRKTPLGNHSEPQVQDSAATSAETTGTDAAMTASFTGGAKTVGPLAAGIGTPLGKIAMARFGVGTTVTNDGAATSGPPVEMGPPGQGQIGKLKTGARDVGSVDPMASRLQVTAASQILNAMLQIETARQGNAKKVMDLIK